MYREMDPVVGKQSERLPLYIYTVLNLEEMNASQHILREGRRLMIWQFCVRGQWIRQLS